MTFNSQLVFLLTIPLLFACFAHFLFTFAILSKFILITVKQAGGRLFEVGSCVAECSNAASDLYSKVIFLDFAVVSLLPFLNIIYRLFFKYKLISRISKFYILNLFSKLVPLMAIITILAIGHVWKFTMAWNNAFYTVLKEHLAGDLTVTRINSITSSLKSIQPFEKK